MSRRTDVPFEVDFYHVMATLWLIGMLIWGVVRYPHITLGDIILFGLLWKITRFCRETRRAFGAR